MDGPGTLRRTECKMKETFNQTSFRLGGFDLSPSQSPARAASGRPKLVSDAKSPRSVVERGLLYAACKLQLRRRSAIPFRMTGTGMTDSTSRHCTRRAPDSTARIRLHATSSSHAAHSGSLPAGRHLCTRDRSHIARAGFGACPLLLPPMPAEQRASLTGLLHPGSSNTSFSSPPPFAAPPAGRTAFVKVDEQLLDIDY